MDGAKEIARDMLDAIHIDGTGFLGAVAKGFISFPVSLGYLGYDFIDTEHRRENEDDKYRLAKLVKRITFNKETIEMIIRPFIDEFVSHVDINQVKSFAKNMAGTALGKLVFSQTTGLNIGKVIASRGVASYISGAGVGLVLAIGAEASRAIYTSRYLSERNPAMYEKLYRMGDFDLLYFLIEDVVRPYEKACEVAEREPREFNEVCKYFFEGL